MTRFFRFLTALALILGVSFTCAVPLALAATEKLSTESQFIQSLGDMAVSILSDKSISEAKREENFRTLLRNNFDLKTIARFVIGRSWYAATPAEKEEYLDLFEKMVIKTYSERFSLYTGEGFKVVSSNKESDRDYIVNSEITHPDNAPATTVSWRVRNKKGHMGIIDVIVEGVSMSVTQRQEYSSIIQRNSGKIVALLDVMRQRVKEPLKKK